MALKVIEDDGHEGRSQMMRVMVIGARQGMVGDLVEVSHHLSGTAFQLRSKTG
jgi:tyrosine-protein phosphatase YwqE